jgi:hypothetical protein
MTKTSSQIKSSKRVSEFAEVFTNQKEINSMIALVENEALRIDSRFLEPACGEGVFLISILEKKISTFYKKLKNFQEDFEISLFISVSSLYGIEILEDNVEICRAKIFSFAKDIYSNTFSQSINESYLSSLNFVLSRNIVHGNALTMEDASSGNAINFTEWSIIKNNIVKRREYQFNDLMAYQRSSEPDLFSDLGEEAFIPPVEKDYPAISLYELVEK